jgi:hypothetical protein
VTTIRISTCDFWATNKGSSTSQHTARYTELAPATAGMLDASRAVKEYLATLDDAAFGERGAGDEVLVVEIAGVNPGRPATNAAHRRIGRQPHGAEERTFSAVSIN